MNNKLRIPAKVIDRATAELYPDTTQLALDWIDCGAHVVAECPPCETAWRFDQLAHTSIGYYPGDPVRETLFPEGKRAEDPPPLLPHGNRYAHRCPSCKNDLTHQVQLHLDACRLARRPREGEPT